MKRFLAVWAAFILIFIMASCSTKGNTDGLSGDADSASQMPQFAVATKIRATDSQNLTYTGGELRIPYMLRDQSETDAKWGLEIMLDGVLQDFAIESNADADQFAAKKKLHVIPMQQGKTKNITLVFTPNIGQKGQKLNLNICTLLNPGYIPTDITQYEFRPNHNLNGGLGACLTMQQAAPQQTKTSIGEIHILPLTDEQKKPYINENALDADGSPVTSNELGQRLIFQLYQIDPEEKSITVPTGQPEKLTLKCFGKPGKYRLSVYINHELLPVFNGERYLDITVEKDKAYQHTITIDQDGLSDKAHIYAVASPIYENDTRGMWYLEKTPSKLVMKQGA